MVQRVPVRIGMWRPCAAEGFDANLWGRGLAALRGVRVACAICYEQLLVWPMVTSLAQRPAVLVGAANDWWARYTSIPRMQRQAVNAWARLSGVPAVQATNL